VQSELLLRAKVHGVPSRRRPRRISLGLMLEDARTSGPVFIEKHGQEQAVLLSISTYNELIGKSKSSDEKKLDGLREEFDALYARMQTAASRKGVDRLLSASAEELNATARKRRG
jgi:PHD/YefM family antitoxin component YafN of YafNO toxin-antitoxin module